jgi:hypothetical protein
MIDMLPSLIQTSPYDDDDVEQKRDGATVTNGSDGYLTTHVQTLISSSVAGKSAAMPIREYQTLLTLRKHMTVLISSRHRKGKISWKEIDETLDKYAAAAEEDAKRIACDGPVPFLSCNVR